MRILIHACCANCLLYPYRVLKEEFDEIYVLWFNSNIHPYGEYLKRREALMTLAGLKNLKVIYIDDYDIVEFTRKVVFRETKRCLFCYHVRLERAASIAKKGNFDYFTTTLLYSKHQKHDLIREIGESVARERGVRFYYRDFREGWKEGIEESKELGLYRQNYCGCIYSEAERYGFKIGGAG